jgi:hypothetical protein
LTVTTNLVVAKHSPGTASGVKIYTAEAWLSTEEGLQVPVMPFVEVGGKAGTVAPAQITSEGPKANVGTVFWLTVTVSDVVVAHCPAAGVNVYTADAWLSIAEGLHVPVTPLDDNVGKAGTLLPAQNVSDVPKLN